MPQPPVIVVPGITATTLHDFYPLEPETVWSAIQHQAYTRVALHPDNVRYEALEPARVLPANPFGRVYGDLLEALRHDLTAKADEPTPVFGFGYDWRQDCSFSAQQLAAFVEEALARTALVPHYHEPPTEIDLVGHSMGGLIIARYLADRAAERGPGRKRTARVRRVVTIGTPFRGSMDAVLKVAMGMGLLTGPEPREREREAARTISALYQVMPSYPGAVSFPAGLPPDLFDVRVWQPSIIETLAEFIRLHQARIAAPALLAQYLKTARAFIDGVNALKPADALRNGEDDWLPIAGIGAETHLRADVRLDAQNRPWFFFAAPVNAGADTGDNTVPFPGAVPDFLNPDRFVCVRKDDLSFWELRDRLLVEVGTLHAFLPKINHVHKLVIRFLRDDLRWTLKAWPAPGVSRVRWPAWLQPR
jgi:pimeloyl-ACP methyl ester carboxylesterase